MGRSDVNLPGNAYSNPRPLAASSIEEEKMFDLRNNWIRALGLFVMPGLALASTISVQPTTATEASGTTFAVTIVGSGFTVPVDAGGLNITWDPMVLALGPAGVSLDPIWVAPSTPGTVGTGSITGMFLFDNTAPNPLPNPGVSFNIATIEFKASASGSSSISVAENSTNPFAGAGAQITGIAFNSAAITVPGAISGIPEPGSITLVLIGVGACGWICRRRIAWT